MATDEMSDTLGLLDYIADGSQNLRQLYLNDKHEAVLYFSIRVIGTMMECFTLHRLYSHCNYFLFMSKETRLVTRVWHIA